MDEKNKKRRTSILKKRPSTEDEPTEITVSKFPKRNQIQFSQKKQVKEFTQCEENLTIWGNTYETSVGKSEGSSDGSSTSRKISVDFSHTTINVTNHEAASMNESEKENLMVQKSPPRKSDEARPSLNNLSSASNSGCSIELTTVDMNADERKRVNKYGTDNLNITNMPLDNSYFKNKHLNVPGKNTDKILSPRKMIYLHKSSNLSVIIKDKVLMSPSEMDDNVSVSIEDDEKQENIKATGAYRKTITKPVDMNISMENKTSEVKKEEEKQQPIFKTIPKIIKTPAVEKPQSMPKIVPTVFKFPEVPKTFNFQPQIYDSPPIKPATLSHQKEEIDELFEMMISDTPSKNLCCIGKTHTPMKSEQKVLFSTSRPTSLRNSTDIFREIGLIDDDADVKLKSVRKTIFHNDSMKVDATHKDVNRKTIFDKIKMDETIDAKNKTQNDGDLDISIEPEKKVDPVPSRYEIFTDKMEETCTEKLNEKSAAQKSFFDLDDDDASCSVARNVQLMKLKSIDYGSVEKSLKRSTLSNDTCNATNFIMELTNIDDTGGSLETTAEIQRKATKLLKNPHATLGSSSTINSPFPEEISETIIKEVSKVHKSLNLEPDKTLEKSSTSYKNRMTTFDENKMEISGIEPTFEDPKVYATNYSMQRKSNMEMSQKNASKIHEEPSKSRVTTYNVDQMDVTNIGTPVQAPIKQLVNNRVTTYNADTMDITNIRTTSQFQANKPVNSRVTTYNADQMDTTRMDVPKNPDETLRNFQNSSKSYKNRMTTFDENKMEISGIEPTFEELKVYPIDFSMKKKSNMEMSQKNASKVHEDVVIQPTKSRVTSYNIDQMDISRAEATLNMPEHTNMANLRVSKQYEIHVSPKELAKAKRADRSDVNHSNSLEVSKSRATTYNINKMDISGSETKNPADNLATKIQIYNDDIEQNMSMEVKESPLHKKRATIHNRNDMDASALMIEKKRTTNYLVNNMDITETAGSSEFCEQSPLAELQRKATKLLKNPHATLGSSSTINSPFPEEISETIIKEVSKVHKSLNLEPDKTLEKSSTSYKNRMTTFDVNKMEISGIEPTFEDPKVYASNYSMQRKSNMEMSKIHIDPVIQTVNSRITNYNADTMDVTNIGTTSQMQANKTVNSRVTSYNIDQMDISRAETTLNMPEHTNTANLRVSKQYEIHVSPKELAKAKRADRSALNHSNYLELPKSRATTYNVNKMDISGSETKNPAEGSKSIPKIQIYNDDIEQNMSMEVKESPLHKKRATIHNRNDMDVSALMIDQKRTSNYLVNNMDVSVTAGSSGFCEQSPSVQQPEVESNDRRKTFTVTNKRESMKWHNITDTDLLNMIDDESNPCVQDISASIPVSSESNNVSRYEEAMEDFMNLTVKASPLNQSVPFDVKMRQRRESRVLSPVRDYNSMFDNLIQDLKQKDRPKPRLEIDEYLEKLKIEPVKIPYYPQNQEGYMLNKIKELRQKHKDDAEKERRLKKEIEATQFPQIPSAKFLMKNYIECMEIEILKEVEKRRPVIAPVFPEAIDFEELLNNKFRTDEHLSKYWNLDSLFLYKGSFKLTHKMMNMFTLNIKCQQYLTEADESTIPIIFKDVMLYLGPDFRKPWSKTLKNSLSRRQFHRAINGVDNFTSICGSSNHLFTFLDYYHTNVMKANETVNNFFSIINKYKAVFKVHHLYKHEMVRKRCFLSDDIVDIEISVEGYLEDISIKNLLIDGNDFTYTLEPHANIIETKGLMLVELILFDTEKFLQNNTSRIKIEED